MRSIDNANWMGIDNIHASIEMDAVHSGNDGPRKFLVNATNVDITDSGDIVRRPGTTQRVSGAHFSGIGFFRWLIAINAGQVVAYDTGTWSKVVIGSTSSTELGHCHVGDELYLSDGQNQWILTKDLKVTNGWGDPLGMGGNTTPTVYSDPNSDPNTTLDRTRLQKFPASTKLAFVNGRIFAAYGNAVIYTEPYMYSVWDPSRNFYQFTTDVTFLFANTEVVVVSAEATYVIDEPGSDEASLVPALPYPTPTCTPAIDAESKVAYWLTERGWVSIGESDKMLKMLTYSTLATVRHKSAAVGMVKRANVTSVVAVGVPDPNYPDANPLVSGDFLESERNRKEV